MTAKEYLESQGYEFEPDEFWGDEYVEGPHKWKEITAYMEAYANQKAEYLRKEQADRIQQLIDRWEEYHTNPMALIAELEAIKKELK